MRDPESVPGTELRRLFEATMITNFAKLVTVVASENGKAWRHYIAQPGRAERLLPVLLGNDAGDLLAPAAPCSLISRQVELCKHCDSLAKSTKYDNWDRVAGGVGQELSMLATFIAPKWGDCAPAEVYESQKK
jgi:hypothetical protein